jgi:hypothetical protein
MTSNDPDFGTLSLAGGAGALTVPPLAGAEDETVTPEVWTEDMEIIDQIEQLPPEIGWLLIYVGFLGFVLPGIVGFPFLIAGLGIVTPGGRKRVAKWVGKNPPRFVHFSVRQISRLVEDLDRRYPLLPKDGKK